MRRLTMIVTLALALATSAALTASADSANLPSPPFSLPATFSGTTTCADCPGIRVTLSLSADGTYALERDYLDRDTKSTENGKWSYDATRGQLRLVPSGANASAELFALDQHPTLQMLGADGKPIPPGPNNVLSQIIQPSPLEGTQWNLASIGGVAYAPQSGERGAFLAFDAPERRLSGSTGCNRIIGPYDRDGANGLHIGALGMTRMACEAHAMQVEGAFLQALASVASFEIQNDALVLFDKSGAPVARLSANP